MNIVLIKNITTGESSYIPTKNDSPISSGDTNYYLFRKIKEGEDEITNKNKTGSVLQKITTYLKKLFGK